MNTIQTNKAPKASLFKSRGKEAVYWEKNINRIWTEGKPVKVKVSRNLSETINIRLDPKTIKVVRHEAESKGIGPTQLIRMWIKEKINTGGLTISP